MNVQCAKSSLAFRKPAVAAATAHAPAARRPARADGPKVGLDGPASLGAGRAPWRAVQHQLSAVGSRILLADADAKQMVSAMSAEAIVS